MAYLKFKKKNGQILDIVVFMVTILVVALTIVFGKYILFAVGSEISNSELSTVESNASLVGFQNQFAVFDYGILFIIFGLTIGLIISSFFIESHPIFLVFNIVGFIFLVFLGAMFANIYGEIINTSPINETMVPGGMYYGGYDLGNTTYLMSVMPFLCAFIVLISTIVMYAKSRVG